MITRNRAVVSTYWLTTCAAAFATASLAQSIDETDTTAAAEARTAFQAVHQPDDSNDHVAVVTFPDGRVASVIGSFAGLDAATTVDVAENDLPELTTAVVTFVKDNHELFGIGDQIIDLRPSAVFEIDPAEFVAHFQQFQFGLRVLDSEITAVFSTSGRIHAIHGPWHAPIVPLLPTGQMSPEDAVGIIEAFAQVQLFGALKADKRDGGEVFTDGAGQILERALDPNLATVVWTGFTTIGPFKIDEATETVLELGFKDYSVPGYCDVKYLDFDRSPTDGRVTSFHTSATNGTPIEDPACVADRDPILPFPGTCRWWLAYDESGTSHAIGLIEDWDLFSWDWAHVDVPVGWGQDCTPQSSFPDFFATSGHSSRQQIAYVAANGMRAFMLDNVWGQITPDYDFMVHTSIDLNPTQLALECPAGGRACYHPYEHEIYANADAANEINVLWHEYGHSVTETYGNIGPWCNDTDHSWPITETFATVFAMINAADDPDIHPQYGALDFIAPHTNIANRIDDLGSCDEDPHDVGNHMLQAMWEVMFNRDCHLVSCTATSGFSNQIWSDANLWDTVLKRLGKSIAYALKTLPANVTFDQISTEISHRIHIDFSSTVEAKFDAVLTHHGLAHY